MFFKDSGDKSLLQNYKFRYVRFFIEAMRFFPMSFAILSVSAVSSWESKVKDSKELLNVLFLKRTERSMQSRLSLIKSDFIVFF